MKRQVNNKEEKRGGARPGSGRKAGTGEGRKNKSASISMPHEVWDKLDRLRGDETRSGWIAKKIRKSK